MRTYFKSSSLLSATFVVCTALLLLFSSPVYAKHHHAKKFIHNPVIFVHGGAGSASQFESQAMRFMSNGYPKDHLYALEYDSSFTINSIPMVHSNLDALITKVLEATGKTQVDLMGHSLGTYVSQAYLSSSPLRAARVARWVNIDGYPAAELPGGVPTLALWAGIGNGGWVAGAKNVTMENQTHVQTATSAESFFEMYTFLTGGEPKTTRVVPQWCKKIEIAGRACLFPENIGVAGAELKIYKISSRSGKRLHKRPRAVYSLDAEGDFGPFKARAGEMFEFVIVRNGQDHHFYKEAFVRSDYFVRLTTAVVGAGVGSHMDPGPDHANIIVSRDKEFWGERPLENDVVAINGVNIVTADNCTFANRTNVLIVSDVDADGESDLGRPLDVPPMDYFHGLPFMTGIDLFIPTDSDKVRITSIPRGGNGLMQVINIPAWPSDTNRISVQFNDFVQWDSKY